MHVESIEFNTKKFNFLINILHFLNFTYRKIKLKKKSYFYHKK